MGSDSDMITVDFEHPMGVLKTIFNRKNKTIFQISFVPTKNINPSKIEALDWFFEDGDGVYTGWGTALKESK